MAQTTCSVGTFRTTEKIRQYVNRVLDTERISYGPMSRELEQRFSRLHGCDFGVLSNSGTSSLQVALQALEWQRGGKWGFCGREVIVPAVTFVATANVVIHNNLNPVFVDVDPDYYEIDPQKIEDAITTDTVAIIPVHLFGQPCNMAEIMDIAKRHNLAVIEDSCESMFVGYDSKPVGSWGDIGCFSFYVAHLLTAGVGGMGTTNDPDLAAKMRSLVNHGRDGIYISIDDDAASGDALKEIVSKRFRFEALGHSYRITEFEAAVALAQLDDWGDIIASRQLNAAYLTRHLRRLEEEGKIKLPALRPNARHAFMMYPIVVQHEDKWGLCNYLESNGVETREMLPLINQPVYKGWVDADERFPVAEFINSNGFYVGCHQDMLPQDLDKIVYTISTYFDEVQL